MREDEKELVPEPQKKGKSFSFKKAVSIAAGVALAAGGTVGAREANTQQKVQEDLAGSDSRARMEQNLTSEELSEVVDGKSEGGAVSNEPAIGVVGEITNAGQSVVDRFLGSGKINSADAEGLKPKDLSAVKVVVGDYQGDFIFINKPGEGTVVYHEFVGRHGTSDWNRLLKTTEKVINSSGREVEMTSWKWDVDTNPATTKDNITLLSYPSSANDWSDSGAEVFFKGTYRPGAPNSELVLNGVKVPTTKISPDIRSILVK